MLSKVLGLASVLALGLMLTGCSEPQGALESSASGDDDVHTVSWCAKCGQEAGGEACCKADAEICESCQLHKGSPGCCTIEKGEGTVSICTMCGELAGGEKCCKEGTECAKCGLHEGSPGCCKVEQHDH